MKWNQGLATFMIAAVTPQVLAEVILDQDAKVQPAIGAALVASFSVAAGTDGWDLLQTFTAGRSGQLAAIGLQTYQSSGPVTTFTLSLFQGNGSVSGNLPVAQTNFLITQTQQQYLLGGMVYVDLTNLNFNVEAGSVYSYEVAAPHSVGSAFSSGQLAFAIGYAFPGEQPIISDYEGGRAYRRNWVDGVNQGWDLSANFASDRGFQTFVDVSLVPEVPMWLMLAAGLAFFSGVARRETSSSDRAD